MNAIDTLNRWAGLWAGFMGERLIDGTVVLAVVGGLWLLLHRKASPQLGYGLFLLVLAKLLIPFEPGPAPWMNYFSPRQAVTRAVAWTGTAEFIPRTWIAPSPTRGDPAPAMAPVTSEASPPLTELPSESSLSLATMAPALPRLSGYFLLMLAWASVVLMLAARYAFIQRRTRQLVRQAKPLDTARVPLDLAALQSSIGLRGKVALVSSPAVTVPVVWGWFRPRLLVPADFFESFSLNQGCWILLHELGHIRRSDLLVSWLQKWVQIVYFFHPAVWLANWMIDQQREYACDDMALAACNAPRADCGEGFLSVVHRVNQMKQLNVMPLGLLNSSTHIRWRMMRILDTHRPLHQRLSFYSLGCLVFTALLVLPSLRAEENSVSLNIEENSVDIPNYDMPGLLLRIAWDNRNNDIFIGRVSMDGQYLLITDRKTGDLASLEISTGIVRNLEIKKSGPDEDEFCSGAALSPDNQQVAYSWINPRLNVKELRVIDIDGSNSHTIFSAAADDIKPLEWTPDGQNVLIFHDGRSYDDGFDSENGLDRDNLAWISVLDGTARILETLEEGWTVSDACHSPDGRLVAYTLYQPAGEGEYSSHVVVLDTTTNQNSRILNLSDNEKLLGWSCDGKWIMFADLDEESDQIQPWISQINNGISQGPSSRVFPIGKFDRFGNALSLNPLGLTVDNKYFYVSYRSNGGIYLASLDSQTGTLPMPDLSEGGIMGLSYSCAWSPDGAKLLYAALAKEPSHPVTHSIHIYTPSKDEHITLPIHWPNSDAESYWNFQWDADGKSIWAIGNKEDDIYHIFRIEAETGQATSVIQSASPIAIEDYALSPDQRSLYYSVITDDTNVKNSEIRVHELLTGQERVLYRNPDLWSMDLSPDGQWVAFSLARQSENISVCNIIPSIGGESKEIVKWEDSSGFDNLTWNPDGKGLLFTHNDADGRNLELCRVSVDGGTLQKLWASKDSGYAITRLSIHPDGKQFAIGFLQWSQELWVMEDFLPIN